MMPNLHRTRSDSNNTSIILELHTSNYLPKFQQLPFFLLLLLQLAFISYGVAKPYRSTK